jgi:hypothetical protein
LFADADVWLAAVDNVGLSVLLQDGPVGCSPPRPRSTNITLFCSPRIGVGATTLISVVLSILLFVESFCGLYGSVLFSPGFTHAV